MNDIFKNLSQLCWIIIIIHNKNIDSKSREKTNKLKQLVDKNKNGMWFG